ncbi:hypothetical protein [Enterococcus hailinensis]|uniref:hypothetical protein n=1 Tax=Enterococcus hailinensis TaxID=3238988 RepID=UPI0038B393EC
MEHEYDIQRYLNADRVIRCLEKRKRLITKEIYNQTLTTHLSYDGLTVHVEAPRIENIVSDNVVACELIDERIKRLKDKQKYFIRFVDTLPRNERESLLNGNAIMEIECLVHNFDKPESIEFVRDTAIERRNLIDAQRIDIILKSEELIMNIRSKAKNNQLKGTSDPTGTKVNTNKEIAGVGSMTRFF